METPSATVDTEERNVEVSMPGEKEESSQSITRAVLNGVIGGLLATVTMTIYRLPIARSLPPTEEFWEQYGPGDADGGPLIALLLHLGYGTGGGIAFGAVFARLIPEGSSEGKREATSIGLGLLYGAVLSLFGSRVLLSRVLGMDLDPDEVLVFHVSHAIYALTLGTWVGSRIRRKD